MKRLPTILLITLLAIFTACTDPGNHSADATGIPIYFLAPANSSKGSDALQCSLEPLDLSEGASLTQKAHTIINRLLQGSHDGLLSSPFPQDTTLSSVEVKNRRAHVDFSGSLRGFGSAPYCPCPAFFPASPWSSCLPFPPSTFPRSWAAPIPC